MLHVPVALLVPLPDGRAEDGDLVQLQQLLTQTVLEVLVQLTAAQQNIHYITDKNKPTLQLKSSRSG